MTSAEQLPLLLLLAGIRHANQAPVWQTLAPDFRFDLEDLGELLAFAGQSGALGPTYDARTRRLQDQAGVEGLYHYLVAAANQLPTLHASGRELLARHPELSRAVDASLDRIAARLPLASPPRLYLHYDCLNLHVRLTARGLTPPASYAAMLELCKRERVDLNLCEQPQITDGQRQSAWDSIRRLAAELEQLAAAPA